MPNVSMIFEDKMKKSDAVMTLIITNQFKETFGICQIS